MKARRKKTGARVASARKATSARRPAARSSASKAAPAKKSARDAVGSAKRSTQVPRRATEAQRSTQTLGTAKAKTRTTVLGADCTIEHAPALHEQLAKVIADRACVTLDFSTVKRCDTAGLQMLAAFLRERREAGLAVELIGTSENFLATANVLGLAALFGADGSTAEAGVA